MMKYFCSLKYDITDNLKLMFDIINYDRMDDC